MYHRYGRHGARAWLRWHKKHTARPATSLVPVVRSIIVQLFIPANVERIIFIVTDHDTDKVIQQPHDITIYTDSEILSQRQIDEQQTMVASNHSKLDRTLEIRAKSRASKQANAHQKEDIQLSESELDNLTRQYWEQDNLDPHLDQDIAQRGFEQAQRDYYTTYKTKYREVNSLPTLSTREAKIRQIAREDKKQYANTLLPHLVPLQATSRMIHYVPLDIVEWIEYLFELDGLVKTYISYYDEYTPQQQKEVQTTDQYYFRQ